MTETGVKEALGEVEFSKAVITAVAEKFSTEQSTELEIVLPETLKAQIGPFIETQLGKQFGRGIEASFSKKIAGGFRIGPKDGGWFISMTEESFIELIGSYLRPATRKILFG